MTTAAAPTYEGTPCRKCGNTTRYKKSRTCVACAKKHSQRSSEKIRLRISQEKPLPGSTFHGKPCKTCSGTLRYVKRSICVTCARAKSRSEWARTAKCENRKATRRRWELLRRYNTTPEYVDLLFMAQGSVCAICKSSSPKGKHGWNLDHCHATGEIRGVLCVKCNWGIAAFSDSPETLSAAIAYVSAKDDRDVRKFFAQEGEWLIGHMENK